jgi:hypothetical protein
MKVVCLFVLAVTLERVASAGANDPVDALLMHPIRARGENVVSADVGECDGDAGEKRPAVGGPPCDVWGAVTQQTVAELALRCRDVERMTPETRERLFAAISPELVSSSEYLERLPKRPEVVARVREIYDTAIDRGQPKARKGIDEWLRRHEAARSAELVSGASKLSYDGCWLNGGEDLEALANIDWARAAPLLRRYAASSNPYIATNARALTYRHQIVVSSPSASATRTELQRTATNRRANPGARDRALDELVRRDWPGRDEWVASLFGDPTLLRLDNGSCVSQPLLVAPLRDPDRWIPRLTKMVASRDQATHDNAADALAEFNLEDGRADALRPLLPWLVHPGWGKEPFVAPTARLRIVQTVADVGLTEAIPGLRWIVDHDPDASYRGYAAEALQRLGSPAPSASLRKALAEAHVGDDLHLLVRVLVESRGLPDTDAADSVVAYARSTMTGGERDRAIAESKASIEVSIGRAYARARYERLADILSARVAELRATNPALADRLLSLVGAWPCVSLEDRFTDLLSKGAAGADAIASFIDRRESLGSQTKHRLRQLVNVGGTQSGIAAVLIADRAAMSALLEGHDAGAKRGLLAAARLARETLPLPPIAVALGSSPTMTAAAAYLAADPRAEARALFVSKYPGAIVGERPASDAGHITYAWFDAWERSLIRSGDAEVIALAKASYWGGNTAVVLIRVDPDGQGSIELPPKKPRPLRMERLAKLRRFLDEQRVADLAPLEHLGFDDGVQWEFVRATPRGGYRVYMNNPDEVGVWGQVIKAMSDAGAP